MKTKSLLRQFMSGILIILLVTLMLSGGFQFYMLNEEMQRSIENDANMISQSIQQGIAETNLAAEMIEHQIDLKLESYAQRVSEHLAGRNIHEITEHQLLELSQKLGLASISLFERTEEDIVGIISTDPKEIGFSFRKNVPPDLFKALDDMVKGMKPVHKEGVTSYVNDNISILYVAQSGAHADKPMFYKYANYHMPGTSYLLSVYIEAGEVNEFIAEVGPESWIQKVLSENESVKEIALLDPVVFADPSLMDHPFFPFKQVVNGKYELKADEDIPVIIDMLNNSKPANFIHSIDGNEVYKMLVPTEEGKVVYVALDYNKLIAPLYQQTVMQIVSGVVSLIALFSLITVFFNRIYRSIQKIKSQIKMLEAGDFTSHSSIAGSSELVDLSNSTNRMVDALRSVLKETSDHAEKVQRSAVLLEAEANQSVEKMFALSMETTGKSRDMVEELDDFLNKVEGELKLQTGSEQTGNILERINYIRDIVKQGSNSTTDITITLSDLLKSLHAQSSGLSETSNHLLQKMEKFKL